MDVFYFYMCVTAVKRTVFNENMYGNKSNVKKENDLEIKIVLKFWIFINSIQSICGCLTLKYLRNILRYKPVIYVHEQWLLNDFILSYEKLIIVISDISWIAILSNIICLYRVTIKSICYPRLKSNVNDRMS